MVVDKCCSYLYGILHFNLSFRIDLYESIINQWWLLSPLLSLWLFSRGIVLYTIHGHYNNSKGFTFTNYFIRCYKITKCMPEYKYDHHQCHMVFRPCHEQHLLICHYIEL